MSIILYQAQVSSFTNLFLFFYSSIRLLFSIMFVYSSKPMLLLGISSILLVCLYAHIVYNIDTQLEWLSDSDSELQTESDTQSHSQSEW